MAFSKLSNADNVGYIIPYQIIKHFLQVGSNKHYTSSNESKSPLKPCISYQNKFGILELDAILAWCLSALPHQSIRQAAFLLVSILKDTAIA